MSIKIRFLLLLTISTTLTISSTRAQDRIVNKDYTLKKDTVKLLLMPVLVKNAGTLDSILVKKFDDELQHLTVVQPSAINPKLSHNQRLTRLVRNIINKTYTRTEFKSYPSLATILKNAEVNYVKNELDSADLMLIAVEYKLFSSASSKTSAGINFRLYDLNTGSFILRCRIVANSSLSGQKGADEVNVELVEKFHEFYVENFIERQGIE